VEESSGHLSAGSDEYRLVAANAEAEAGHGRGAFFTGGYNATRAPASSSARRRARVALAAEHASGLVPVIGIADEDPHEGKAEGTDVARGAYPSVVWILDRLSSSGPWLSLARPLSSTVRGSESSSASKTAYIREDRVP
jgi:hypothetical protein